MKSLGLKVNDDSFMFDQALSETGRTITFGLEKQIKDKYSTFTNFNYRRVLQEARVARKKKKEIFKQPQVNNALQKFFLATIAESSDEQKPVKSKVKPVQELAGVKSERRERFKRGGNCLQIMKHYIEKQGLKPKQEELHLMRGLAELREISEQGNLDLTLKNIYRFMNEAVDFNELRFLCLLVILAGDICTQFKDFNRAFYFYDQARIFSAYSNLHSLKTEALLSLGFITQQLKYYTEAILFYKKALQYSWKTKNQQTELLIYDYLGEAFYYAGELKKSQYYHRRFTQGEPEHNDSAIKRISTQMLDQYEKYISSMERSNLTSLFLQYLNLPISGLSTINQVNVGQRVRSLYPNYDEDGQSPRKNRKTKSFEFHDFSEIGKQLEKLITEDQQFRTQIPNPDVQQSFVAKQMFGKARKNIAFEQSSEYHKITGTIAFKIDLSQLHSSSVEKRIESVLSERPNTNWWPQMKDKIRKNQTQKVGQLRERIRNSHQSYNKFPEERRRAHSLKNEGIRQSFNKTLLDWIDPQ